MIRLYLANYNWLINPSKYIYCIIKKKYVICTNEELVRQNIIYFLIKEKNYPIIYFNIEKDILIGKIKKRIDIIVYHEGRPFLLIECKSTTIKITKSIFDQIHIYNSFFKSSFLMITNGIKHFIFKIKNKKYFFFSSIPSHK